MSHLLLLIFLLFASSLPFTSSHAANFVIKDIRQAQRQSCEGNDDGFDTAYPQCVNISGRVIEGWTLENFFHAFICDSSSPCSSLFLSYHRNQCLEEYYRLVADFY